MPAFTAADISIVNQAIGLAGGEPIDDFSGDTPLSEFAAENWPAKKAFLLSLYRWRFVDVFRHLEQLATAPDDCPLPFAFKYPLDLGGAIHAVRNGQDMRTSQLIEVVQTKDYIAADQAPLWAEYTGGADASAWPPWFAELVKVAFAADVCPRVMRRGAAQDFMVKAYGPPEMNGQGGLMLAAMQADSRDAPQRSLSYGNGNALVDARYGIGVGNNRFGLGWPNNGFPFIVEVQGP